MRSFLRLLAALLVLPSCGSDGPVTAPFGLDQRPSNPTCLAQHRPVINTGVMLQPQWSALTFSEPLFLLQAPGDNNQWFVVQREGKVRAFAGNATADSQVRDFVTVTVNSTGEGGLLGMAFHPQWPTRREVYLYYTRTPAAGDPAPVCPPAMTSQLISVISRFQSNDGTQ